MHFIFKLNRFERNDHAVILHNVEHKHVRNYRHGFFRIESAIQLQRGTGAIVSAVIAKGKSENFTARSDTRRYNPD